MKEYSNRLQLILGWLVAVIVTAVSSAAVAQDVPKVTVRLDFVPWGMHAGLHLAKEKGWFDQAKVDVTIMDGKGSALLMQQVAAGDVDVGWGLLSTMAAARGQGLPLISIAAFGRTGDLGFIVPKGKYKTVKSLEGQKIAYSAVTGAGPYLDLFLKAGGSSKDKFQILNVDPPAQGSTFTSGASEAVFSGIAYIMPIVSEVRPADPILMSDVGITVPGYGLVTTPKVIERNAEGLRRFVPVVVRAWEYIYDGHVDEGVAAIMKERPDAKLDPVILKGQIEAYRKLFWTPNTKDKKFGWQSDQDWEESLKILERIQVVPSGWKASDYYTNQFVSEK
jgi:NitT/TauT family transport system substrate-binding protein